MPHSIRIRPQLRYRIASVPPWLVRDRDASDASEVAARLLDAIRPSILRALTAERAGAYVTILAEMLALRRTGTLAPTLDELRRQCSNGPLDEPAFLRDLLQLEEWGCVTRELEPQSIRGYRDARRERFRHRLTEDVVALLEWLETRLARGTSALRVDANDRLLDVLERALELLRLADREGDLCVDGGRRALHLVRSIDTELEAIACGLVGLHAEMRRFAGRSFEPRALERVVAGLEGYVAGVLANMGERRRELDAAIARLTETETSERLSALARTDGDRLPFTSYDEHARTPAEMMARWPAFFAAGGELDHHCAQIEAATHDVIAKLRDRLAALERRGDKGHERTCAIRALASIDDARVGKLAAWGYGTPTWAPGEGTRLVPPLPRRKTRPRVEEPRALPIKHASREIVPEPRRARVKRIAEWLRDAGLTGGAVRLSEMRRDALAGVEAPAAWITVARAQHLGRGVGLSALGVRIEPTGGVVTVGDDAVGLASPDCVVSGVDRLGSAEHPGRSADCEDGGRP